MFTILLIVLIVVVVWLLAAVALAFGLGRAVKIADRREYPNRQRA